AYGALALGVITWIVIRISADNPTSFLMAASLMATSIWMMGFHQIHSYAHMGSRLSPAEFNRAVADISGLDSRRRQKEEFARLFRSAGVPRVVSLLQRSRLFLRPEVHWRHHINFESNFSSVNGWSDPLMNLVYGPLARWRKGKRATGRTAVEALS